MKATKFFKLKEEWEKAKQPDTKTIPVVEEVKQEEPTLAPKTTKKKTTNVE